MTVSCARGDEVYKLSQELRWKCRGQSHLVQISDHALEFFNLRVALTPEAIKIRLRIIIHPISDDLGLSTYLLSNYLFTIQLQYIYPQV